MQAIILAAGMGRRLGHQMPKCLTPLHDGLSILDLQLANIRALTPNVRIVVGYRAPLVIDRYSACAFTHNERYDRTNTATSLRLALDDVPDDDVLLVNGDVVFNLDALRRLVAGRSSAMAGQRGRVGEEEVKYRTDGRGQIRSVSKTLKDGEGEAVGINMLRASDLARVRTALRACAPNDYFERAIELAIADGLEIFERDISDLPCMEVDFPADLEVARRIAPQCLPPVPA